MQNDESSLDQAYEPTVVQSSSVVSGNNSGSGFGHSKLSPFHFNRTAFLFTSLAMLAVAFIASTGVYFFTASHSNKSGAGTSQDYSVSTLSTDGARKSKDLQVGQVDQLAVNGQLKVSNTVVLSPTTAPTAPKAGQIYYDKNTQAPYYYNGSAFVSLAPEHVTSLGGGSGRISVDNTLTMVNNQLSVSSALVQSIAAIQQSPRVSSLQGQTGDLTLTAGAGIGISGTTISNQGVLSLSGTANQINVSGTTGNLTIGLPQSIAPTSTPTFAGLNLSGNLAFSDGNGHFNRFNSAGLLQDQIITIPQSSVSADELCLKSLGNCGAGSDYVKNIGTVTGLTLGGTNSGAGSVPTLSVNYGSVANTSVQGNTTLVCPAGTGNLTGGGNTITLGAGGTCNGLTVVSSPTFSGNLAVQGSGGITVGNAGVNTGIVTFADGNNNSFFGHLQIAALTQSVTYNLPASSFATEEICLKNAANCVGSGGLGGSGTAGTLAVFGAGGTSLADSVISQTTSGTPMVTIGGDLTVGAITANRLQGTGALTITAGSNIDIDGGTHILTLQGNASSTLVINSNGHKTTVGFTAISDNTDKTITFPDASGTVCLQNANCGFASAGSGVTSLNGLAGALSINNASASGSSITINNAVADGSTKGIATFNASNFTASAGVINTIQNIGTTANVTFGSLTLGNGGNITLASNGTVFADNLKTADASHDLTLDAGAKNLIFKTNNGDSFTFPTGGGAGQTICTTGVTCASGGGQAVILEPGGGVQTVNGNLNAIYINKHSGSGSLIKLQAQDIDAFVIDNAGATTIKSVTVSNTLTVDTIQASSSGSLTVGDTGHTFTLQGDHNSTVKALDNGTSFTTSLGFGRKAGNTAPTGNVSYILQNDSSVLPGTYYVCTTAGNCNGAGGAITGSGSTGKLPIFTSGSNLGDSIVSGTSTQISVAGDLAVGVSGHGSLTLGVGSTQNGSLVFKNVTNNNNVTILPASGVNAPTGNVTLQLPNASGTFAVSASGPLSLDPVTGELSCATCLTGGGGGGAGVSSLNGLAGALSINNASASGSSITINNAAADGSTKGIAAFNATNFSAASGVINTIQDIASGATPTFNGAVLQGNNGLTLGKAGLGGQVGQIFFKDGSTSNTLTLTQNTLSGARTINIPDMSGTLVVAAGTNLTMGTAGRLDVVASPSFTSVSASGSVAAGSFLIGSNNINTAGTLSNVAYLNASNNAFTGTATFSGVLTVGTPGNNGTLAISSSGSTRQVNLQALNPSGSGDATVRIPTINGGSTDDICLKTLANCTGNGSGGSNFINNSTTKQTNSNFYVSATTGVAGSLQGATGAHILDLYAAGGSTPIAYVDDAGNITAVGGTFSGAVATGALTSSGTITFSSLNSAGVVHTNGSGQLSTSKIVDGDLQSGTFTNITGTGALTAGSIGGSFGAISTSSNITTTAALQGNTVNATGTGAALKLNGTDINTAGTLSNVAYLSATSNQTFAGALTVQAAGGLTLGNGSTQGKLLIVSASNGSTVTISAKNRTNALDLSIPIAAGSETTDELCLKTAGNCVGAGGGVTTSTGTANAVARFTGSTTIGIGKLYDDGTKVSVGDSTLAGAGLFNVGSSNQFQVSAAGAVTATGLAVRPAADSASLMQVQNALGTSLITLDSTAGNLVTNPSFETNVSGWTGVSFQDNAAYSGTKSGYITMAAGGSVTGNLNSNLATSTQYTLSFWYKRGSGSPASISIAYGGGTCSNSFNNSNTWTQVVCTITTGAGTYNSFTITNTSGSAISSFFNIDAFRMEQGLSTGYHQGNLTLNDTNLTIQNAAGSALFVAQVDNHQIAINQSAPSQSNAALDVNGNINVTSGNGYFINGVNINTAGTLSNVAYLGQSQTFTGNNTFNGNNTYGGTQSFKNASDSTAAFKIQNASSQALFNVDTTGGNLIVNAGFESGTTGWSGSSSVFTNPGAHNGTVAGYYQLANAGTLTGTFSSNLSTSTQYTLSFWYKRTGTPASMSTSVAFGGGTCTPTLTNSGSWTQVTCTITTGAGTYNSFTITNTSGSGDSTFGFFDDFTITTGATAASWMSGALSLGVDSTSTIALNGTVNSAVLLKNAVNSATAFQIQNSAGSSLLTADTSAMRLSVGSRGTATAQLYIAGQTPVLAGQANGTGVTNAGNAVAAQGRYAYVVSNTTTSSNGLQVFDVSNPVSPVNIKSVNTTATSGTKAIKIYGKYAYVAGYNGSAGVLEIFDISNPGSPVSVGTQTFTATAGVYSLYVQGHYAYAADSGTAALYVFDIANPASISAATTVAGVGSSVGPMSIYGQGRYLYLANNTSANAFQVVDLSNPASPAVVKTLLNTSFGSGTLRSVTVQGRYAYVGITGGSLYTVDISDPTAAAVVGSSVSVGGSLVGLSAQSRYLYAISGSSIATVDISVPAAPVLVSGTASAASPSSMMAAGRYLYVSNGATANMLQVFDLGGTYTQQLEAGGLETDTLSVRGPGSFANDVSIQGALNVGAGLQVGGNVGFTTTATSGVGFTVNAASLTSGNAQTINSGAGGLAITTAATTSTGLSVTANSQTGGNVLSVSSSSAAYTTGALANISQVASYTSTNNASSLLNVSRTLTSNIPTPGAITKYNSQAYSGVTTGQNLSFDAGTANYRALVVTATVGNSSYTGSGSWPVLTYGGVSLGNPITLSTNGSNTTEYIYVLANNQVPTGTNNLVMTAGGQSGQTTLVAQSWTNVDQTTPVNSFTSGSNSGTSSSITIPSTGSSHVIVDGIATTATGGVLSTTQTGQTSIYVASGATYGGSSYRLGSAGSVMGWQQFGGSWSFMQVAVDLNPASAPSLSVTGAVASFASNCLTPGSSGCTDSSNILNLNQQYASATGAVLQIQNAGTGNDITLGNGKIDSTGAISLGVSTATGLTIGHVGVATSINGTVNINASAGSSVTNIATGSTSGAVNVGGSSAGQITLQSGTGTTVKGTTANTFVIQNATTNGNIFQVDAANSNVTINGQNSPNIQTWSTGVSTGLSAINSSMNIVANGYIYVIGGLNNSNVGQKSVYYSKINANGSNGSWTATSGTSQLPNPRVDSGVAYENGYIYIVGGSSDNNSSNATDTVYYAKVNADGSLGAWQTGNPLNVSGSQKRWQMNAFTYNGYLYIASGTNTSASNSTAVYYTKLNADGSNSTWTATTSMPSAINDGSYAVSNGYAYIVSGGVVYYAKLNPNGGISGSWNTSSFASNRIGAGIAILNGYIYVIGGVNGSAASGSTFFAPVNSNGSIGSWSCQGSGSDCSGASSIVNSTALPANRAWFGTSPVTANGYMYVIGGTNVNAGGSFNTVYYTSTARTQINGSLDLVGSSNGNLAEAGSGGNLTAGNTRVIGSLDVQSAANFAQNVSIGNDLNVGDQANIVGTLSVGGAVTFSSTLAVTGMATFSAGITVNGHIITSGSAITTWSNATGSGADGFLGTGGSCSVSGNDQGGLITLNVKTDAFNGVLCHITFNTPFSTTPRVIVSPQDRESGALDAFGGAISNSAFDVGATASIGGSNKTYYLNYFVIQY